MPAIGKQHAGTGKLAGIDWLAGLSLIALAILAYLPALSAAFQFDDYAVIVDNPAVHSWAAWLDSMPGMRPLLKLSYTFNWQLDPAPQGFHLFNVLCHGLNSLLVLLLMRRIPNQPPWMPWVAVALFALHPLHTEAVTYVSGRSVSLMAFFYLASLWLYIKGVQDKAARWQGMGLLLFLAACGVKETAWTLPFAVLLWLNAIERMSWRAGLRKTAPMLAILMVALAFLLALPTYRYLLTFSLESRDAYSNILTQINGQFYLVQQWWLPWRANIDPDLAVLAGWDWTLMAKTLSLLGLFGMAAWQWSRRPWLALGIAWFFLHLLPTNSLIPRLDVANDRQLYLAGIGFCLLCGSGLGQAIQRYRHHACHPVAIVVCGLMLCLAGLTWLRNQDYRSEVSLWQATVTHSPQKARAWLNLGYAYQLAGDPDKARQAYQQALALRPDYPQARLNWLLLDGPVILPARP